MNNDLQNPKSKIKNNKNIEKSTSNYRYERKCVVPRSLIRDLEYYIKTHPAIFTEVYSERYVNNIYFDTIDYKNFFDNVYGNVNKIKPRIRWYGELFGLVKHPILEYKIKKGLLNKKKSYPISSFHLNSNINISMIKSILNKSELPFNINDQMKRIFPSLLNRYSRKYFLSADKKYRITIDNNLYYLKISRTNFSFMNCFINRNNIILEIKYNENDDVNIDQITQSLPLRYSKNSKYIDGISQINFLPS